MINGEKHAKNNEKLQDVQDSDAKPQENWFLQATELTRPA